MCAIPSSDFGKKCSTDDDCEGRCNGGFDPKTPGIIHDGKCSPSATNVFGCAEIRDGKVVDGICE